MTRQDLTLDQRTFVRVAARQREVEQMLLALEAATEAAARKPKNVRRAEPTPPPMSPAQARRHRAKTCPSRSRYRQHRKTGEKCPKCSVFMRELWADDRAAHPERQQRAMDKRRDRLAAQTAGKVADMAARRAAVMAQFVEDAA